MAINLDNAKITIDFGFKDEGVDYQIRFHYTEELGETISLSEDGQNYLSYPALMFKEIGIFLKDRNLLKDIEEQDTEEKIKPKKTKNANILDNVLKTPKNEPRDTGISSFGGLSIPTVEGETEILSKAPSEDSSEDHSENVFSKYAENIEELPEPAIIDEESDNFSEDIVEKEWLKRERGSSTTDPKTMIKRKT